MAVRTAFVVASARTSCRVLAAVLPLRPHTPSPLNPHLTSSPLTTSPPNHKKAFTILPGVPKLLDPDATMVGVKVDQSVTLYVAKLRQAFADQAVFAEEEAEAHLDAAERAEARTALKVLLTTPHYLTASTQP